MKTLNEIKAELLARGCTVDNLDPGDPGYDAAVESWAAEVYALAAPPAEISMAQFRLALLAGGIDPNTIAQSLAGDPAALIRWEYSTTVRRAHPLVTAMADQLKKSPAEVDAIFIAAAAF